MSLWGVVAMFCVGTEAAVVTPVVPPPVESAGVVSDPLTLDVVIAVDPDLAPLTERDVQLVLNEAKETVEKKLGYAGLSFQVRRRTSLREFMDAYAPLDSDCMKSFASTRVRPGSLRARDVGVAAVLPFLKRWPLAQLQEFFPKPDRAALTSYEILADKLLQEFDKKVDLIAQFKLANGASLLAPEAIDTRSYVRWVCAMRQQDEADLVLTNAFALYDLGTEPFPHSIFQKCKVGGASLASPKRRAMRGRAMMASTFSMTTDLPFFREDGILDLRPQERLEVIGSFIVAHELGHALFKMPDFYDHPKECLMTTKYETGYVSGYWYLKAYPGVCPACGPWVSAKRQVFAADAARAQGKFDEAIKALQDTIKATPKHIDGNYLNYIADLSCEVAELYFQKGDRTQAERWLAALLKRVPTHAAGLELQARLKAVPNAPSPAASPN